ncbi:unnamed protein product [Acanthosepion pharaonis]|uniref:Tyrosine-protein kinase ephrin type A/B receptor-like domain-containing protein n=1 Tax=Acanthosepion pharaonis TaxID=158019 RepID=A0A812CSP5_ACAPH|nr:unnamed protein product [Sepia pharaonis]
MRMIAAAFPCSANTTMTTGATSASNCSVQFCNSGSDRNNMSVPCTPCPEGFYRMLNMSNPFAECSQCPENFTTSGEGGSSCPLLYCRFAGYEIGPSRNSCIACAKGFYKNNTARILEKCSPCPQDFTTTITEGATNISQCDLRICSAGQFRDNVSNTCKDCHQGYYQPNITTGNCLKCAANYTTLASGSKNESDCIFYCRFAGYEIGPSGNSCIACAKGFYKNNTAGILEKCSPCPQNFTTTITEGATNISQCDLRICSAGQFRDNVSNTCKDCHQGYYQPNITTGNCLKCAANYTTLASGSKNESDCIFYCHFAGYEIGPSGNSCIACAKGFYKNNTAGILEKCSPCPQNFTTSVTEGATNISQCDLRDCPEGTFINGDNCTLCPNATYQPERSKYKCELCGNNTFTSRLGATEKKECQLICLAGFEGQDKCIPCKIDYFKPTAGPISCRKCPMHFLANNIRTICNIFSCEKGFYNVTNSSCDPCAIGEYKNQSGNFPCSPCPDPTFTTASNGSGTVQQCNVVNCQPGNEFNKATNTCVACPIGTYQNKTGDHPCETCPKNFITATVGVSNIFDCSVLHCSPGYYNQSTDSCRPCAKGTFKSQSGNTPCKSCSNPAYTTPLTGSTSDINCTVVNCQPGYRFNNTADTCVACPIGTYQNKIGDHPCEDCPKHFITATEGTSNISDCSVCKMSHIFHFLCIQSLYLFISTSLFCLSLSLSLFISTSLHILTHSVHIYLSFHSLSLFISTSLFVSSVHIYLSLFVSSVHIYLSLFVSSVHISTSLFSLLCSYLPLSLCLLCSYLPLSLCLLCSYLPLSLCLLCSYLPLSLCLLCSYLPLSLCLLSVPLFIYLSLFVSSVHIYLSLFVSSVHIYLSLFVSSVHIYLSLFVSSVHIYLSLFVSSVHIYLCSNPAYTTPLTGSTSDVNCTVVNCQTGYRFNNTADTCVACPIGTYQNKIGDHPCEDCPRNFITATEGISNISDCSVLNCQPGYRFNNTADTCVACPIGTYQNKIGDHPCEDCPKNFITATEGTSNISDCSVLHCLPGYYNQSASLCKLCEKGTFKSQSGNTPCKSCSNPAYTTPLTGSTSDVNCTIVNCQPGYRFNNTADACVACPFGTYQNKIGEHPCKTCPENLLTATEGVGNISDCSVFNCSPGYEFDENTNQCIKCAKGTYQPDTGNTTCLSCRTNFTTFRNGSTKQSDCLLLTNNSASEAVVVTISFDYSFSNCESNKNFYKNKFNIIMMQRLKEMSKSDATLSGCSVEISCSFALEVSGVCGPPDSNTWIFVVIGCLAGILTIVLIIVAIVLRLRYKRQKKKKKYEQFEEELKFNYPFSLSTRTPFGHSWNRNTQL